MDDYSRDHALTMLAERYFTSHGPATLEDYVWWSGLKISDARIAIQNLSSSLESIPMNNQEYYVVQNAKTRSNDEVHFLPAFDEYYISYSDRSAIVSIREESRVVSVNGVFRPMIICGGKIIGIWQRKLKKNSVEVICIYFKSPARQIRIRVEQAAHAFADFLEKDISISHED